MPISIKPVSDESGNVIFPHIAPGTFIGDGTQVIGAAWIDFGVLRHSVNINADIPSSQYTTYLARFREENLKQTPFSVVIGKAVSLDDGTHLHPISDLLQSTHLGNHVTVGHNCQLHGMYMGNDTVAFLNSVTAEMTIMNDKSYLAADALLKNDEKLLTGQLYIGDKKIDVEPYHQDKAAAAHHVNTVEAMHKLDFAPKALVWNDLSDANKRDINLSKLLYSAEAIREIAGEIGNDDLKEKAQKVSSLVNDYWVATLREEKQTGKYQVDAAVQSLFKELSQAKLPTKVSIAHSLIRSNINLNDDTKDIHQTSYTYEHVELMNIKNFLELIQQRPIERINEFYDLDNGTGIEGSWALYGKTHHKEQENSILQKNSTPVKDLTELMERQYKSPVFFMAQNGIFIRAIEESLPDSEFAKLINVLRDIGDQKEIVNRDESNRLLGNAKSIFEGIQTQDLKSIVGEYMLRHSMDLAKFTRYEKFNQIQEVGIEGLVESLKKSWDQIPAHDITIDEKAKFKRQDIKLT